MTQREYRLHNGKKGAALAVRITPRASKNQIIGALSDGTIKIHMTTGSEDEATNDELLGFLSYVLGVDKSRIEVVAGTSGRDKLISVLDMDSETLHQKIVAHMD